MTNLENECQRLQLKVENLELKLEVAMFGQRFAMFLFVAMLMILIVSLSVHNFK